MHSSNYQLPSLHETFHLGQYRTSNGMAAQCLLEPKFDNNVLPPLQQHVHERGLFHGINMERKSSTTSLDDLLARNAGYQSPYTHSSSNYSSRSNTPGGLMSPALSDREPYLASACSTPAQAFPPGPRCPSCLAHGEHIPVALGKDCPECGITNDKQQSRSKASRKKRTDRILHSKMNQVNRTTMKASKDKMEGGRRLDQTTYQGRMQRQLQNNNPSIADQAGWKRLKPNNISSDSQTPLQFNKEHVLQSAIDTIDQDNTIIAETCKRDDEIRSQARNLLASNPDPAQMSAFIALMANDNWSKSVRESAVTRGSKNFKRPSDIIKQRYAKL